MRSFNIIAKVTGWPLWAILCRSKYYFQDKAVQGRHINGKAIIASNHISIWDFAAMLFIFPTRCLRCVVAELMYEKNIFMSFLLKWAGTIKVDRNNNDFAFLTRCAKILDNGGVVEIFPEARLPLKGEETPIKFKPSAVYLALQTDTPIIPVYTNGIYFSFSQRHKAVIGTPINVTELYDSTLSEKENVNNITEELRRRIIALEQTIKETG